MANVKIYSLKKDGNTKLSKNFRVREFACHDGSDRILIDSDLVTLLQKIRDHFVAAVTPTSAYRTPTWNARNGGAQSSYHVRGQAADIVIAGHTPNEVAKYAESLGIKGIGLYVYAGGNFVHIDTRTTKYYWKQTAKNSKYFTVHTFGAASGTAYKVTVASGLRLRAAGNIKAAIVATMPCGASITVMDISNGWAKAAYNRMTGWCSMNYLKKC